MKDFRRDREVGITSNLGSLALFLLGGCIITTLLTIVYIIGIIKYTKKDRIILKELKKIDINDINYKENI